MYIVSIRRFFNHARLSNVDFAELARREPEQYVCFVTPEAYRLFSEYTEYRKVHGESLAPEAPTIRDEFAVSRGRFVYIPLSHLKMG